ncbi:MAG: serine hydrolase, partial [Chloroflexota bacterium]
EGIAAAGPRPSPAMTVTPTLAPTPSPVAAVNAGNARTAQFKAIVAQYLDGLPGTFGVVVKDLKTGDTLVVNGDRPFATASLYKLWLAAEALRQGKQGQLDLNQKVAVEERHWAEAEFDEKLPVGLTVSIDRSLWFLITLSSNAAASLLNDYVSWSEVNGLMRDLGFSQSRMQPDSSLPDLGDWRDQRSSSTPNEMLRFFELAYQGKLVDKQVSDGVMYLLRNQQIDDRLSRNLPAGVVMAHKTGNLTGVVNDVGIIFGPTTDLYVGVMTDGADYDSTMPALRGLGQALYDAANAGE